MSKAAQGACEPFPHALPASPLGVPGPRSQAGMGPSSRWPSHAEPRTARRSTPDRRQPSASCQTPRSGTLTLSLLKSLPICQFRHDNTNRPWRESTAWSGYLRAAQSGLLKERGLPACGSCV